MGIVDVLDLLACPLCRHSLALAPDGRSVGCPSGHAFDLARQGYLNLQGRAAPENADTSAMVAARDRFLSRGHYQPVADRLLALARERAPRRLLDVGTGTGYYASRLLDGLPAARGVGMDVSPAAARRAARAHPRLGAVVADAWGVLPVPDGSLDAVLNVFAPRNPAEFRRVLTPSGVLLSVTPQAEHLGELLLPLGLLKVQPDKQHQLAARLTSSFVPLAEELLSYPCRLDRAEVGNLITMGPNSFHLTEAQIAESAAALPDPVTVTVAVRLQAWSLRP